MRPLWHTDRPGRVHQPLVVLLPGVPARPSAAAYGLRAARRVRPCAPRGDRSLHAYGQEGRPCARCGTPIVRVAFTNRSSFFCPVCQPAPRRRRTG
ncbi:zinc finger domain-containing protein [Nocardioides marmoraquaticus]